MIPKSDITSSPQEARVTTGSTTLSSNVVKNKRMFKALTINFNDDDDVKSVVNGSRKHKSTSNDDDVKSVVNGRTKHKSSSSSIFSSSKRIFGGGSGGGVRRGQGKNNSKATKKGGSKSGDDRGGNKVPSKKQQDEQQQRRRNKKKILKHLGAQVACPLSGAFLHNDGDDLIEKLDNLMAIPAVIKEEEDDDEYDCDDDNIKDVCGSDIVVDCCDTDRSDDSNLTASTIMTTNTTTTSSTRSLEEEEFRRTASVRSDSAVLKNIVGFVDTVQTWRIPTVSTYTKEEWEDCWYSDVERKELHCKRMKVIVRMELGKPELPYRPYRGLENWTTEGNDAFKFTTKRMIDAVLDEQENQWRNNIDDHDQIATISQTVSVLSVIKAIRNAQQDENDANEIYLMPSTTTENHDMLGGNDSFQSSVSIVDSVEDDEVETVSFGLSSVQLDSKKKKTKQVQFSDSSSLSARLLSKKKKKKRSSGGAPSFQSLVARMNSIENDVEDMVQSNEVVDLEEV